MPRAAGSRRGGDISTPRGRGRARAGRREKGRTDRKPSTGRRASCSRARGRVAFDDVGIGGGVGGSIRQRSLSGALVVVVSVIVGGRYIQDAPAAARTWTSLGLRGRREALESALAQAQRAPRRAAPIARARSPRGPPSRGRRPTSFRSGAKTANCTFNQPYELKPSQGGDVHASPRRVAGVPTRPHRAHASTRRARTRRIARAGRPDGRRRRALERSGATAKAAGGEASQLAPRER